MFRDVGVQCKLPVIVTSTPGRDESELSDIETDISDISIDLPSQESSHLQVILRFVEFPLCSILTLIYTYMLCLPIQMCVLLLRVYIRCTNYGCRFCISSIFTIIISIISIILFIFV